MSLSKDVLRKNIQIANKSIPADVVIKNGRVLDVFNLEWLDLDVALSNGKIVGLGTFEGKETIDAKGRYICPSFIDAHVHIESSMVPPSEFAKVVLPHGVTTVITDPHEIANVLGQKGIEFMIKNSETLPLEVYLMLPSCVPSTPFENAGAILKAEDLKPFLKNERVLGLAEVMDYPSLANAEDPMLDKIELTRSHDGKIDGHLAGLVTNAINVYRTAGVTTDHECNTVEEAKDRLRRGMYLLIREGSVAKDLSSLIGVVTPANARRCLFCTDDKHLDELTEEGSIDHHIRLAIQAGVPPLQAYQMASLNAAECYGLYHKGAIAPGYDADFLIVDDLESVKISEVYKNGERLAQNGKYLASDQDKKSADPEITSTVHFKVLQEKDFEIPISDSKQAHIIEINPNQLKTNKVIEEVHAVEGYFSPSVAQDQLKMIVVERHKQTGNVGAGIVKGFGLKAGAIATTIAHDSHNIVAIGTNDQDLMTAIQALKEIQGGLVVVKDCQVIASLPLPIAGLMSDQDFRTVNVGLEEIKKALNSLGFKGGFNPFLTLSFLTLPVIPSLKLTDTGLFDVEDFKHIRVSVDRT
ncbi:adenine deaminase [Halobacillus sp. BBL2006]|uniref:adenine deaminase n=1 Tax=Halobacillus sp. BBL2006 TaxID=1543706 RepID=UPI0005435142|nr:adenine deaminase [Halobacillus sp. BBL2006]KHE68438.1 adenine deaminase [Halobacillus sp. BBL2006]